MNGSEIISRIQKMQTNLEVWGLKEKIVVQLELFLLLEKTIELENQLDLIVKN